MDSRSVSRGVALRRNDLRNAHGMDDELLSDNYPCLFDNPGYAALKVVEQRSSETGECEWIGRSVVSRQVTKYSAWSPTADLVDDAVFDLPNDNASKSPRDKGWCPSCDDLRVFSDVTSGNGQYLADPMTTGESSLFEASNEDLQELDCFLNQSWPPQPPANSFAFAAPDSTSHSIAAPATSCLSDASNDVGKHSCEKRQRRTKRTTGRRPVHGGPKRSTAVTTGVTMRLRTLLRKLLASSGWIMDSSISKEQATQLISELVGDYIGNLTYTTSLLIGVSRRMTGMFEIEDILPRIITFYTGVCVTQHDVDNFIRRDKGPYHLTEPFVALLDQRPWPPCLPTEAALRAYGCYREGEAIRNR